MQLWCTLAERHLEQRGVDWNQAEKICFNEWSNPDDEELGIQIVKVCACVKYLGIYVLYLMTIIIENLEVKSKNSRQNSG